MKKSSRCCGAAASSQLLRTGQVVSNHSEHVPTAGRDPPTNATVRTFTPAAAESLPTRLT